MVSPCNSCWPWTHIGHSVSTLLRIKSSPWVCTSGFYVLFQIIFWSQMLWDFSCGDVNKGLYTPDMTHMPDGINYSMNVQIVQTIKLLVFLTAQLWEYLQQSRLLNAKSPCQPIGSHNWAVSAPAAPLLCNLSGVPCASCSLQLS